MSNNDTCKLIEKIKDVLKSHRTNTITNYKLEDKFYLLTDFMIITYTEEDHMIDVAFHISTRADLAALFMLELTKLDEIDDINVMELYMKDEDENLLTGNECIEKYNQILRTDIIDSFVDEQVKTHYLQTTHVGTMC